MEVIEKGGKFTYQYSLKGKDIQLKKFKQPNQHLVMRKFFDQSEYEDSFRQTVRDKVIHVKKEYNWKDEEGHDLKARFTEGRLIEIQVNRGEVVCASSQDLNKLSKEEQVELNCNCNSQP